MPLKKTSQTLRIFRAGMLAVLLLCASACSSGSSPSEPGHHIFDPSRWTITDGLSSALIVETQVSPTGPEVAYTVKRILLEGGLNEWSSEIHVAGEGGSGFRRIGTGIKDAGQPAWSLDASTIAFVGSAAEGDLKGTPQIFLSPAVGGTSRMLTAMPGGVASFEWAPAGNRIAFIAIEIPEVGPGPGGPDDDATVEGAGSPRMNIWVVDVSTGSVPVRITDGDYRIEGFVWSPDGRSIAFTHYRASSPEGWHEDISVVDVASRLVTALAATPAAEMGPVYSPDGSTIAFIRGDNPTADFSAWRVQLVPAPGSANGITRTLAATPDELPMLVGWSADGETIFFDEAVGTAHMIGALPVSGGPPAMLSAEDSVIGAVSLSADGGTLSFTMQDFRTPQEVYLAAVVTQGRLVPRRVSRENEDVTVMPVPRMDLLRWMSDDGTRVEGMLTYPLGYEEGKRYPLVLSIHGGPAEKFSQGYFGQPDVYPYAAWASEGYAVLRINPRGSGGYGGAFRAANIADWDVGPYNDLMTGVDRVIAMGVADSDRMAVIGWSYGGHMTANITTRTSRFKAAVVGAGPVDLVSQAGTTDLPDMIPAYMGGYPWEIPDVYRSQSPIFFADAVRTPTMILHGTDDTRVPYSQAQEWYAALRARGVECELVGYPRSGHVVHEPQLMNDLQLRTTEWVKRHLFPGQ